MEMTRSTFVNVSPTTERSVSNNTRDRPRLKSRMALNRLSSSNDSWMQRGFHLSLISDSSGCVTPSELRRRLRSSFQDRANAVDSAWVKHTIADLPALVPSIRNTESCSIAAASCTYNG
jgi:hypothetical protein